MLTSILVVDDDPISYFVTTKFLQKRNLTKTIAIAKNAKEALSIVKIDCPSLILLDLHMPAMDEYGFLKNLALQLPEFCLKTKLVLLTTFFYEDEINKFKDVHFDAFIVKPFKVWDTEKLLKICHS